MRNILKMKYPASWHGEMWREGVPAGNGLIGALVYGGIYKEIIMLTHTRLWRGSRTVPLPDVSGKLAEMRGLLEKNDPIAAEHVMSDALAQAGYNGELGTPLPLCDLLVTMPSEMPFKQYQRELDMESGVVTVSWSEGDSRFTRVLFVSRADDTVYYRISACGTGKVNATLAFTVHDTETLGNNKLPGNSEASSGDGFIRFAAQNDDGTDFGAVARVMHDGSAHYSNGAFEITGASDVMVFARLFIHGDRNSDFTRMETGLAMADIDYYDSSLRRHTALHSALFNAATFDLYADGRDKSVEELLLEAYQGEAPQALQEKLWSMGRYLLISASREGGLPCHLYGLWMGDWRAFWAFNMFNVNLQMIYWQALSGNMPELLLPVFEYLEAKMDDFRENARKVYGCRGININSVSTPESGLHKCISPHILHWTGAAAWLSQLYYDYFLYTGDMDFLKKRAMPFMYEASLFYEDFFILGKDGFYVSSPSNSPENTPGNLARLGFGCEVTVNATMDFALFKELITNLLASAIRCGIHSEKVSIWKEMLMHIPPYKINEDGAVSEWIHPFYIDNYQHRHLSHIYPLFPGTEVTRQNNPVLFQAFQTAIQKRMTIGQKDQSGWSLAYQANILSRIGEGDQALECIDLLCRTNVMKNLLTVHNDWRRMGAAVCDDFRLAPVQIDANMGITSAMQEMVMSSTMDTVSILHALPESWKKGSVGPLLAMGQILISIKWDIKNCHGTVLLHNHGVETSRTVILPNNMIFTSGNNKAEIFLKAGSITNLTWHLDNS